MAQFKQIPADEKIREVIKAAFDAELPVSGGWGYTREEATVIGSGTENAPVGQIEHMLASMRTHLEMNMTLEESDRYGSINLNEAGREEYQKDGKVFHRVTYGITAIKESLYNTFIDEYKENYGKEDFDLDRHFEKRKKATLARSEDYWFEIRLVAV